MGEFISKKSSTERQRKFMGAELGRKREGKKTVTGMSEEQLSEFASKPLAKAGEKKFGPTDKCSKCGYEFTSPGHKPVRCPKCNANFPGFEYKSTKKLCKAIDEFVEKQENKLKKKTGAPIKRTRTHAGGLHPALQAEKERAEWHGNVPKAYRRYEGQRYF